MTEKSIISWFEVIALASIFSALAAAFYHIAPLTFMPDSSGYTSIADEIGNAYAKTEGGLLAVRARFRMLGYPAILAAVKDISPSGTYEPIYLVQLSVAVLSGLVLFWTLRRLGLKAVWGGILSFIFLAAYPLPLASFVLTDGINNALTSIALCLIILLSPTSQLRSTRLIAFFGGAAMAVAFLLRESNQYLWLAFLPLVAAATWSRTRLVRACAARIILFALPVVLTVEGYRSFNADRSGEQEITTGGRTAMMQPVVSLARAHPEIYDGSTPLDRVARQSLRTYEFSDIVVVNNRLFALGLREGEIARAARAKFVEAWQRYPKSMLTEALARTSFAKQLFALLNPVGALDWAARWRNPSVVPAFRSIVTVFLARDERAIGIALLLIGGAVISAALFIYFFVGVPIAAFRAFRCGKTSEALILLSLPVCYVGYVLVYALIHVEMRYLGGIAVLPILAVPLAAPWLMSRDMSGSILFARRKNSRSGGLPEHRGHGAEYANCPCFESSASIVVC